MTDIDEIRADFEKVMGKNHPSPRWTPRNRW